MSGKPHLLLISEDRGNAAALARAQASLDSGEAVTWICSTQTSQTHNELEASAALKNTYMSALNLLVITREERQPFDVLTGELTRNRVNQCADLLFEPNSISHVVVAGIDARQREIAGWLKERLPKLDAELLAVNRGQTSGLTPQIQAIPQPTKHTQVTIILQSRELKFAMPHTAGTLLDGAEDAGIDLPFSCRGGVCSTCRAKLTEGEVELIENYALEDWELDAGFTLPCQAEPVSDQITLDYDQV